eukprot:4135169-Pyramimonas_sp.AAC.1
MERERATLASKMAEEKAALATRLDREAAAHEMEKAKLAAKMAEERALLTAQVRHVTYRGSRGGLEGAKMAEERALLTAQVRPTHHNITSFYGPSCANNGEDALNTPESIHVKRIVCALASAGGGEDGAADQAGDGGVHPRGGEAPAGGEARGGEGGAGLPARGGEGG